MERVVQLLLVEAKTQVEDVVIHYHPEPRFTFLVESSVCGDKIPCFYRNLILVLERSIELDVNRPGQSVGHPVDVRVGVEHSTDVRENDAVTKASVA